MFSKSIALVASLVAFASAAPACPAPTPVPTTNTSTAFSLIAIRSGSDVQYKNVDAWKSSILLGREQNASCAVKNDYATFFLQDGGMYLYAESATPQQLYVDRSGMGQGKVGYTTGAEPAPRNGERTGFAFDASNYLQFDGSSFSACPTGLGDGSYSIWASSGTTIAGLQNCTGLALRRVDIAEPVSCLYTS